LAQEHPQRQKLTANQNYPPQSSNANFHLFLFFTLLPEMSTHSHPLPWTGVRNMTESPSSPRFHQSNAFKYCSKNVHTLGRREPDLIWHAMLSVSVSRSNLPAGNSPAKEWLGHPTCWWALRNKQTERQRQSVKRAFCTDYWTPPNCSKILNTKILNVV
jgi:hypothetical protein